MEVKIKSKNRTVSELRRDLVTGNWVVVARARGDRPLPKRLPEIDDPIETCPFEDPQKSGNADPVLVYPSVGPDWSLLVMPNKYPAFSGTGCPVITKHGPYRAQEGRGFHEVFVLRDHAKHFGVLAQRKIEEVFGAYRERYLALKNEECVKYISIFHNHGKRAGASLSHPHSQLIAIPILPSDVRRSLDGSNAFYKKHKKCVHCVMMEWELEEKKRVVFENSDFIAFCPFISRDAYGMRIYPKTHSAYFEEIKDQKIKLLAEVFSEVFGRLYQKFENPAYNFYLHTAPIDGERYTNYHWHFEIRPKIGMGAGFELGTGIEISTVEPERAAAILRS